VVRPSVGPRRERGRGPRSWPRRSLALLVHVDVRRLQTEQGRVVLRAYRDDKVQRFVAEAVEQRAENAEVPVVDGTQRDGTQRDVDDRQAAQRVQPRELRLRWLRLDRTDALRCVRNRLGYLLLCST
jgi:hypothetical protein